jgi:hypothetical protein
MAFGNIPFQPAFASPTDVLPLYAPKGATEAWPEGAVLIEDAAQLDEAGSDPAANTIVGIAAERTTTAAAAGTMVPYFPNLPNRIWKGSLNVAAGGHVLAAADFLTQYGLAIDSGGIWYINQADTSGPTVQVLGSPHEIGTVNPEVYFIILDSPFNTY